MRSFVYDWAVCGVLGCLFTLGAGCSGGGDTAVVGTGGAAGSGAAGGAGVAGAAGGLSGGTQPAGVNVASVGPGFPGAGTSGADKPITVEQSPSSCGTGPADGGSYTVKGPETPDCYYVNSDQGHPAAIIERVVEVAGNQEVVHVRLTLNPVFVDNTYGVNAVGWAASDAGTAAPADGGKPGPGGKAKTGHTFGDLVGSDKAEFKMTDAAGNVALDFYLDYISVDPTKPSGYGTLGVTGGEGKMLVGDASAIVAASTSFDRNFNACGYSTYTVDSPATDRGYTPNASTPAWDYRVVYDVWVSTSAFGAAGFGTAAITYVHASPSKMSSNTIPVTPGDCPPPNDGGPPKTDSGVPCIEFGEGANCGGCVSDGGECTANADCCGGFCTNGLCGRPPCKPQGGACAANADCCNDTDVCTYGTCQAFVIR